MTKQFQYINNIYIKFKVFFVEESISYRNLKKTAAGNFHIFNIPLQLQINEQPVRWFVDLQPNQTGIGYAKIES